MKDFILFLPEIYLILTAVGLILGEVGYHGERVRMILATASIRPESRYSPTESRTRFPSSTGRNMRL